MAVNTDIMENNVDGLILDLMNVGNASFEIYNKCNDICYLEQAVEKFKNVMDIFDMARQEERRELFSAEREIFNQASEKYYEYVQILDTAQKVNETISHLEMDRLPELNQNNTEMHSFLQNTRATHNVEIGKPTSPHSPELLNMWSYGHHGDIEKHESLPEQSSEVKKSRRGTPSQHF